MNKKFYWFSFAALFAFGFAYGFFNRNFQVRGPASEVVGGNGLLITPVNTGAYSPYNSYLPNGYSGYYPQGTQPTIQCNNTLSAQDVQNGANAKAQIDSIFNQAVAGDAQAKQAYAVNRAAIAQAASARSAYVAGNPNTFMWPQNSFDSNAWAYSQNAQTIKFQRESNLNTLSLQIALLYRQNICLFSADQKSDIMNKYMQLLNLNMQISYDDMFTYPVPNTAALLAAQGTAAGAVSPLYSPAPTIDPSPAPDYSAATGVVYQYDQNGQLITK